MITLEDIAQQCGVSKMTVSRALNSEQNIKVTEPLRMRIREIARENGYRPSSIAKSLSSGKTFLVGYICEQFRHFASEIFSAALERLVPAGYDLLALEWQQVLDKKRLLRSVVDRRIDGVLAFPDRKNHTDEHLLELIRYGIPVVLVDRVLSTETLQDQLGFVGPDNRVASRLAVEHLVGLGHRKIGFAARKEDVIYSTTIQRYDSYCESLRKYGLEPLEWFVVDDVMVSPSCGRGAIKRLMDCGVTAVVADNDVVAAKVITKGFSHGLRIPNDMSVVGMGNVESYVSSLYPPLTTIDLGAYQIGCSAVELLLKMIENGAGEVNNVSQDRVVVPVSLKVRASTFPYEMPAKTA